MHDKKPDLSFLHVFGSLYYPTNDSEDWGKLNAKADIVIFVGYTPAKKAFIIYNRRTQKIMETIHVTFDELTTMASEQFSLGPGIQDRLFQPMFDEYFNPPQSVVSPVLVVVAPRAVEIASTPSSTTINQDAPSSSTSSTNQQQQSSIISQGVKEPIPNAHFDDPCHEPLHDVSTSQESSSNVSRQTNLAGYSRTRLVDPTLFIRKAGNDLLLVQIYVDDIIFASTNTAMCDEFANLMTTKFKMSMMGQMSFFLGLQTSQSPRDTPMVEKNKLDEDLQGTPIDATLYRGMIGSLMYLMSSKSDLIYAVCLRARYQAKPTKKYLNVVKRIFRYLKGTINMGLWYSKDTGMSLTTYADADHAG
ncbi:uncharacterized mitochondrial protein-like protein [Tanacetum coccineum]